MIDYQESVWTARPACTGLIAISRVVSYAYRTLGMKYIASRTPETVDHYSACRVITEHSALMRVMINVDQTRLTDWSTATFLLAIVIRVAWTAGLEIHALNRAQTTAQVTLTHAHATVIVPTAARTTNTDTIAG